jgi:hypothetical protein
LTREVDRVITGHAGEWMVGQSPPTFQATIKIRTEDGINLSASASQALGPAIGREDAQEYAWKNLTRSLVASHLLKEREAEALGLLLGLENWVSA